MPDVGPKSQQEDNNLRGWKEIAHYLHSSERTVQRWEHTLRLPVHRIGTHGNAIVLASRQELAIWFDSIEVRNALAEEAGNELPPEPVAEDQAEPQRPARRRVLWATLALGTVAVLVGLVPLSRSLGWNWFGVEKTATPSATTSAGGGGTGSSAPQKAAMVALRLTTDNGRSNIIGVQLGSTARMTLPDRTIYVFSAELLAEGARVHVSRHEGGSPDDTRRPVELPAITLRQGTPVLVDRIPGITALEWVDLATLSKNRAKASK